MSSTMKVIISYLILTAFSVTTVVTPRSFAQNMPILPKPGVMVDLSPAFAPAMVKAITIHPDNPLAFDFLIDQGDVKLSQEEKQVEYQKLAKYFLASLAIPEEELWVNLSPYEKQRIIPETFGKTEMGRDLLAMDYMLKQITASLIYPEKGLGKEFWDKIYKQAHEQFGTSQVPVNTFNKVWITPDVAEVYEKGNTVFLVKSHLKVMLEEDYLSMTKNASVKGGAQGADQAVAGVKDVNKLGNKIVREVILPAIEKEVNEGKNFATLRQLNDALILATWYKKALKDSLLGKVYANKGKVKGVDQPDAKANEEIYQQYLKAFKKGVFNFIKEDTDRYTQEVIPRKYFSGGYALPIQNGPNGAMVGLTQRITPAGWDQVIAFIQRLQAAGPDNVAVVAAEKKGDPIVAVVDSAAASSQQRVLGESQLRVLENDFNRGSRADGVIVDSQLFAGMTWNQVKSMMQVENLSAFMRKNKLAGPKALQDIVKGLVRLEYDVVKRFLEKNGIAIEEGDAPIVNKVEDIRGHLNFLDQLDFFARGASLPERIDRIVIRNPYQAMTWKAFFDEYLSIAALGDSGFNDILRVTVPNQALKGDTIQAGQEIVINDISRDAFFKLMKLLQDKIRTVVPIVKAFRSSLDDQIQKAVAAADIRLELGLVQEVKASPLSKEVVLRSGERVFFQDHSRQGGKVQEVGKLFQLTENNGSLLVFNEADGSFSTLLDVEQAKGSFDYGDMRVTVERLQEGVYKVVLNRWNLQNSNITFARKVSKLAPSKVFSQPDQMINISAAMANEMSAAMITFNENGKARLNISQVQADINKEIEKAIDRKDDFIFKYEPFINPRQRQFLLSAFNVFNKNDLTLKDVEVIFDILKNDGIRGSSLNTAWPRWEQSLKQRGITQDNVVYQSLKEMADYFSRVPSLVKKDVAQQMDALLMGMNPTRFRRAAAALMPTVLTKEVEAKPFISVPLVKSNDFSWQNTPELGNKGFEMYEIEEALEGASLKDSEARKIPWTFKLTELGAQPLVTLVSIALALIKTDQVKSLPGTNDFENQEAQAFIEENKHIVSAIARQLDFNQYNNEDFKKALMFLMRELQEKRVNETIKGVDLKKVRDVFSAYIMSGSQRLPAIFLRGALSADLYNGEFKKTSLGDFYWDEYIAYNRMEPAFRQEIAQRVLDLRELKKAVDVQGNLRFVIDANPLQRLRELRGQFPQEMVKVTIRPDVSVGRSATVVLDTGKFSDVILSIDDVAKTVVVKGQSTIFARSNFETDTVAPYNLSVPISEIIVSVEALANRAMVAMAKLAQVESVLEDMILDLNNAKNSVQADERRVTSIFDNPYGVWERLFQGVYGVDLLAGFPNMSLNDRRLAITMFQVIAEMGLNIRNAKGQEIEVKPVLVVNAKNEIRMRLARADLMFGFSRIQLMDAVLLQLRKFQTALQQDVDSEAPFHVGIYMTNVLRGNMADNVQQAAKVDDPNVVGGIDLNPAFQNLQIKRDGAGVPLPISQQNLDQINLEGLIPVIKSITPAINLPLFSEILGSQPVTPVASATGQTS